ncbi:MAG: PilZ domain-containing protein [Candidatus Hydrogenedentota bacterium]|nr:MAG: PilZ domain-containing protein [Candidatus Hydrogenedentota bacterium]
MEEKRRSPRIPVRINIKTILAGITELEGEAVDLSKEGMGILLNDDVPENLSPGNNIIVHLNHVDLKRELDLPGKIRWIERNPDGNRLGIHLRSENNPDKNMYLAWLEHLHYQKDI